MKSKYNKKPIREFGRVVTGKTPPRKIETAFGDLYPFITPGDLNGSKFIIKTERYLSEDGLASVKNNVIPSNSVLVSCIGSMGKVALSTQKSVTNQQINTIIVDTSKHNPEYVYYALSLEKNSLMRAAGGTTMPILNKTSFENYEIYAPAKKIQDRIVDIIKPLDEKIAHNIAMNQTLEKIAQRIFKSWFIDFDPVKANAEGVPFNGLSPEIQALFPSEFEESELGMIPKGWKILCTQDLFEVKDGTHDSPKKAEEGNYLVTSKHITNGKIDTSSAYLIGHADFEKINQRSKVDTFDILLTMIGTVGEIVVVHDNPVEFAIKNIGLFKTSQKPELVWLFYWYLQSSMMKNYLKVRMAGTTQQYLTLKTLRTIPIIVPSSDILNNFNNLVSPLMKKIASNHKQNDVLSAIQETLLPRLISGRILLSDVNQKLKETE